MYTIQQLQAADYLLKMIMKDDLSPLKEKSLKLVIELNGDYWYGDFINFQNNYPIQYFIDNFGNVEYDRFYFSGDNATKIFRKTMETYYHETRKSLYTNPFSEIHTLDLLFHTIFNLINIADIQPDDSPIYPYLLNAKSIDNKNSLSFINLENQKVNVISIIEVTNASI